MRLAKTPPDRGGLAVRSLLYRIDVMVCIHSESLLMPAAYLVRRTQAVEFLGRREYIK